jgi:hypothetical protein
MIVFFGRANSMKGWRAVFVDLASTYRNRTVESYIATQDPYDCGGVYGKPGSVVFLYV